MYVRKSSAWWKIHSPFFKPGKQTEYYRQESLEKRKPVIRTLIAESVTGEEILFPLAAQAARLSRVRENGKSESVCLITSRPGKGLSAQQWLQYNIDHWGIETGLHGRLDASRNDDRCRLRNPKPLKLHAIFTRIANSLCCEWIFSKKKPENYTTTDFMGYMREEHDRRAISMVTAKRPKLK